MTYRSLGCLSSNWAQSGGAFDLVVSAESDTTPEVRVRNRVMIGRLIGIIQHYWRGDCVVRCETFTCCFHFYLRPAGGMKDVPNQTQAAGK